MFLTLVSAIYGCLGTKNTRIVFFKADYEQRSDVRRVVLDCSKKGNNMFLRLMAAITVVVN